MRRFGRVRAHAVDLIVFIVGAAARGIDPAFYGHRVIHVRIGLIAAVEHVCAHRRNQQRIGTRRGVVRMQIVVFHVQHVHDAVHFDETVHRRIFGGVEILFHVRPVELGALEIEVI